jgi:hypothetical protein
MVNQRSFLTLMLATTLAWSASGAFAATPPATRPASTNPTAIHARIGLDVSTTAPIPFGNLLLNSYRILRGLGGVILPGRNTGNHIEGIEDGPEPVGVKGRGLPTDGPAPASTPAH